MMSSKAISAINILRDEGPIPLAKETSLFLARQTTPGRNLLYRQSLKKIRNRMGKEGDDLTDILHTVLDIEPGYQPYQIRAMQLRDEIKTLATLVEEEEPQGVLEIGTAKGGTFYIWSRYLDSVDNIISLDLPGGQFGGGYNEQKSNIFRNFNPSINMEFVRENSHQKGTFEEVSSRAGEGVDFLFIDGDHTYEGVKQDFEMYSQLVNEGGIIALHDIATHPNSREVVRRRKRNVEDIEDRHLSWGESSPDCNVNQLWDELVEEYETEEIISHPKQTWAGIGVVRI